MRVVARAFSMASMVSGRPTPVPGAGGNWEWASGATASKANVKVVRARDVFTNPPKNLSEAAYLHGPKPIEGQAFDVAAKAPTPGRKNKLRKKNRSKDRQQKSSEEQPRKNNSSSFPPAAGRQRAVPTKSKNCLDPPLGGSLLSGSRTEGPLSHDGGPDEKSNDTESNL